MTTSFHSPLTIHRENTRLPLPALHVSPWPVPPQWAWKVGAPCLVTLTWFRQFCKPEASSTRVPACLPSSRRNTLVVCLKRHFASWVSQATDSETWEAERRRTWWQTRQGTNFQLCGLWETFDPAWSETQATRDCCCTFRIESSCSPLQSYFPQVRRTINSSAKF